MAELTFNTAAARALQALLDDPTRPRLADRVELMLDQLERDSTDDSLGHTEYKSELGLLRLTRAWGEEEWIILWQVTDRVWVHYVGPAGSL